MTGYRFPIWWLMLAVAAVAVSLATLSSVNAFVLVGMAIVILVPVALARRERRLRVLCWVVAGHPAMVLVYLYLTWFMAWIALGHPPRPSLDPPKNIIPMLELPWTMAIFSLYGVPISVITGLSFAYANIVLRSSTYPLVVLTLLWAVTAAVLMWDPFGVVRWLAD